MNLRSLWLLFALFTSSSLSAQTTYFVDPNTGNDGADGSQGTPFVSLTFALTQTTVGDAISLRSGTYAAATETFPILLANRVHIEAFVGEDPIFDAGGAGTLFQVGEDILAGTVFGGVTLTGCTVGVEIPSGRSVNGLTIQQCNFSNFSDSSVGANDGYGVLAVLDTGGLAEQLLIEQCTFAGNGARDAIAIQVSNATILSLGGITGNTSSGGVDRAVSILAASGAVVEQNFGVHENIFAGYLEAGILMHAFGSGIGLGSVSSILCAANGNFLTGPGVAEIGMHLRAEHGLNSGGAMVAPYICFSNVTGNHINILCETINGGGDQADILADFYGNRIENAVRAGVELTSTVPTAGGENNDPNFGPGHFGFAACLNTFSGNGSDFRFGAAVVNSISARNNFFPDGAVSQFGGNADANGILNETLEGSFGVSFASGTAGEVTLTAAAGSAFVDYDGGGATGQLSVTLDGTTILQTEIGVTSLGGSVVLQLPALTAGIKSFIVTNPGGQTGSFNLTVRASGLDVPLPNNDCFVATAALGNYESHEVFALRRFRDQYLKATPAGKQCVDWYYENGPKGAAFLLQHEWARKGARAALVLPVVVADGITQWNPGQRFAFGVLLLGFLLRLTRRRS
ncbi:MAG: DUF1565 domain-containing protein [Planctomycetota bacterium]